MIRTITAALLLTAAVPAAAERLPPRNECVADPSFAAFHARLRVIVERRDAAALLAIVPADIRASFGPDNGKAAFVRQWRLSGPAASRSPIWAELARMLPLGCAVERGQPSIPYLYQRVPQARDPFETLVVTGTRVSLRAAPSAGSRSIAMLDHEILTIVQPNATRGWAHVRTDDGRSGWVARGLLRSPVDYRALFGRQHGRWMMEALVAGD